MFSKTISKSISARGATLQSRLLSTLKPTSTSAAAEPSVSTSVDSDGYSTAAAAETPFNMSNSEAFVETLVSQSKLSFHS